MTLQKDTLAGAGDNAPLLPPSIFIPLKRKKFLVGAVGIEFIKPQNLKELCGTRCSRKSFVVLGQNCNCPRIAPAFSI